MIETSPGLYFLPLSSGGPFPQAPPDLLTHPEGREPMADRMPHPPDTQVCRREAQRRRFFIPAFLPL